MLGLLPQWLNITLDGFQWIGLQLTGWKLIGYVGTLLFASRWWVQLMASRRAQQPVIPRAFWYMSIAGSAMTLSYFLFSPQHDSVGILQNVFPACTACYSLCLDIRYHGWNKRRQL